MEQTLSIIKPDAVKKHLIGDILVRFEKAGLYPVKLQMMTLTLSQAESFYAEHHGRDFYQPLVDFMTSGPSVVMILEGQDAIKRNRQLMGSTNPDLAEPGTIRADHAESTRLNCVHGSDSHESAVREINFFFASHQE
ncbi:nucleoside-diphosphate kinase [Thiomicrospira sp. ALE5]|uniref:nucleoside-diphosphate kinase n=1 Tax=Thiomicrospira sp. ALE5 TaxID=748650 RepID=UPI0008ECB0C6|nr:nucleoside-diphosphate kinase [Thiomicrospira sp. ALE5]SFR63165.1 nucleoside diphosphate kinase [Thiomicrospira sp. ALE5]